MDQLQTISVLEFLEKDSRPTFALNLEESTHQIELKPMFYNDILRSNSALIDFLEGKYARGDSVIAWKFSYQTFRNWIVEDLRTAWGDSYYVFKGFIWKRIVLNENLLVISGTEYGKPDKTRPTSLDRFLSRSESEDINTISDLDPTSSSAASLPQPGKTASSSENVSPLSMPPTLQCFDWTTADPQNLSKYVKSVRAADWRRTPLGPLESWSPELCTMANFIMSDPEPAVLFWGPENAMIYNEHYISVINPPHPDCLGSNVLISLPQYSELVVGVFDTVRKQGKTVEMSELPLVLAVQGERQCEAYARVRFHAILEPPSSVIGIYERITLVTQEVVLQRRLETLTALALKMKAARSIGNLVKVIMLALSRNEKDFIAGAAYVVSPLQPSSTSVESVENLTKKNCPIMCGSFGVPANSSFAPAELDYQQRDVGLIKWFHETQSSGKSVILTTEDGSLPPYLVQDLQLPTHAPCQAVVIAALRQTVKVQPFGWFMLAASPLIMVDEGYLEFLDAITNMTSTAIASLMTMEHALIWKGQESLHQVSLSHKLQEAELQVRQQETFFKHFVELSSMGVFVISPDGKFLYRNRRFDDIHLTHNDTIYTLDRAIDESIDIEYREICQEKFRLLHKDKIPIELECKLTRCWSPTEESAFIQSEDDEKARRVWVLVSAFPENGPTGEIVQILGCITDISALKWGTYVQERRAADAIESKRRLENFIDTTNHELRNPLSAIILAGDDTISTVLDIVQEFPSCSEIPTRISTLLNNLADNGATIVSCAKHQKRIVDDVLTASKLDSDLVDVFPLVVNLTAEISECIKMFQGDAHEANVDIKFEVTPAYKDYEMKLFIFDITRFNQVLINLLTNAIKFTKFENRRSVIIKLDIATNDPCMVKSSKSFPYIERSSSHKDPTAREDWGFGELVYIVVTVTDTGRGMTEMESSNLFARFTQASPKSHVKYGGSGLGLFISRRLSELQGGGIGFSSEFGVGSAFSFFIKARIADDGFSPTKLSLTSGLRTLSASMSASLGKRTSYSPLNGFITDEEIFKAPSVTKSGSASPVIARDHSLLTLLVVEDNVLNQRVVAKQLRRLNCAVLIANHGLEALEHIENSHWCGKTDQTITAVLLDWEMPVMDGLTCVAIIREMEKEGRITGHIPVIGVTANVRPAQLAEMKEKGADITVAKPYRITELMQSVWQLLDELGQTQSSGISNVEA